MLIKFDANKRNALKRINMKKYDNDKRVLMEQISNMREKMKGNYNEDDISDAAYEIRKIFDVDDNEVFPIVAILNSLGIKTFQKRMTPRELSAYISVNPKYLTMYDTTKIAGVNSLDNVGHKRFALAHELAHYIFDYDERDSLTYYSTYRTDDNKDNQEEKRANFFAANILMPEEEFNSTLTECEQMFQKSKPDIVEFMSKKFQVSPTAVMFRFGELGLTEYCR